MAAKNKLINKQKRRAEREVNAEKQAKKRMYQARIREVAMALPGKPEIEALTVVPEEDLDGMLWSAATQEVIDSGRLTKVEENGLQETEETNEAV